MYSGINRHYSCNSVALSNQFAQINDPIFRPESDPDPDDDECELTNLNWLTELKNVGYIELAEGPVDVPLTRFNKFLDELKM